MKYGLKSCLFIMDRGYASEELIKVLSKQSCYLFRLRRKFNKDIDSLPVGSHTVTLYGDIVKNKLELPCFAGCTENVILQDFWITMYLANMVAIARNEENTEINEDGEEVTTSVKHIVPVAL